MKSISINLKLIFMHSKLNCFDYFDISGWFCSFRNDNPKLLFGSYATKSTSVLCLHFSRRNLLLACGPMTLKTWSVSMECRAWIQIMFHHQWPYTEQTWKSSSMEIRVAIRDCFVDIHLEQVWLCNSATCSHSLCTEELMPRSMDVRLMWEGDEQITGSHLGWIRMWAV